MAAVRTIAALIAVGASLTYISSSHADDLSQAAPRQHEVDAILDVLRSTSMTPSNACISALDEMHATDHQLKELTGQLDDNGEAPQAMQSEANEVGVARDVMASDLDMAATSCRHDADAACAAATSAMGKPCDALAHVGTAGHRQ